MQDTIFQLEKPQDLSEARLLVEAAADKSLGEPDHITHGYINQVLLYEADELVARFPRSTYAAGQLQHEANNLKLLADLKLPVLIPKLLHLATSPVWSLNSLIKGKVYASTDIHAWDDATKRNLGADLAAFLFSLHTQLDASTYTNNQPPLLDQITADISACPEGALRTRAAVELEKLKQLTSAGPSVVVYGDTHGANLVFDSRQKLKGVIDFADMHTGTAEEEFRLLYMLDPVVCEAAIQSYEQAGGKLNPELIRQWAITYELAVLCRHHDEPDYPSIPRAQAHLKTWINFEG